MNEPDDEHFQQGRRSPPALLTGWYLALLMLAVAVVYALAINPHWRFQRDSGLYMGLARSLAETGRYAFNGRTHVFVLPGFPAMLSLLYMALGENFLAMNVLVSAFGIGCVALGCLVFRELHLTRFQMLAAALLLAFSRTLYYYSAHVMTDVPFAFLAFTCLYLGLRMVGSRGRSRALWCAGAGVAGAVACTIRPLGPALLVGLLAGIWLEPARTERRARRVGLSVLAVAPTALLAALWARRGMTLGVLLGTTYFERFVGQRGLAATVRHVLRRVPVLVDALCDTVLGTDLGPPVNIALLALMVAGAVRALRRGERLVSVYAFAYLPITFLATPSRRYLLPVLPVLLYWVVLGLSAVRDYVAERRPLIEPRHFARAARVLLALALGVNLLRISKVVDQARAADFYAAIEEGRLLDYWPLMEWLREHGEADDRVLTYEWQMVHYFSRVRTVRMHGESEGVPLRRLARAMRHYQVSHVLLDPEKEGTSAGVRRLMAAYPAAFHRVAAFGQLELYRVGGRRASQDLPGDRQR